MLKLKLVSNTATEATYNYYPEGKEEYGVLSVNKSTGDINIISIAKVDKSRRYLGHTVPKLEECYKSSVYEKEITVAWY